MKINLKELQKLSEQVNIKMSDEELMEIGTSIENITTKLDELLKEDVQGYDSTRTSAKKDYDFTQSENGEMINIIEVNNNDGEYVVLNKGEINED